MRQWMVGVSITTMFGMAIVAAAPRESQEKGKDRQTVTIRGCVRAGTEPNSFMLLNVTEIPPGQTREQPVPTDPQGRAVLYWLSSTKGLKAEIGRRVEVTGTVDLNDPKDGETKVKEDPSKRLDEKQEIKSGGKSVTVKTDTASEAPAKITEKEKHRVLYRLKVAALRRVDGACQ